MKRKTSFLFLCLAVISSAAAQNSVIGRVIDSLSREPVPFANVYFAGTTFGVTTTEDGRFELKGFTSGKYDLTASFVGYYPAQRSLAFENTKHEITLVLLEKATQLDEVVIRPDNRTRPFNLVTFRSTFLGTERNAVLTKIKNEDDIDFDFEDRTRVFTAFSRKPIEVVNDALGYKIIYDLQVFEINYETQMQRYLGTPRFENLNDKIKGRWKRERERAYYGSMIHFVHLLKAGSMADEFEVYEFFRKLNPNRPSAEVLKEKIKYWGLNQLNENGVIKTKTGPRDSLDYYLSLQRLPELVDSIGRRLTDNIKVLMDTDRNRVNYVGMLYVVYKKEAEEENFALQERRRALGQQTSIIHFMQPVNIYENGYYEDTRSIFFEGYLAWAEKLASLLPLGYKP